MIGKKCVNYEAKGVKFSSRPKITWKEIVGKDF